MSTMEYIKIYKYDTIESAIESLKRINAELGYPLNNYTTTTSYTEIIEEEDLIYIYHNDIIENILGDDYIEYEQKQNIDLYI